MMTSTHPTSVRTTFVVDALKIVVAEDSSYSPILVESEFWHMMNQPNLLVGVSIEDEARLVYAISAHTEEVVRNPYHTKAPLSYARQRSPRFRSLSVVKVVKALKWNSV